MPGLASGPLISAYHSNLAGMNERRMVTVQLGSPSGQRRLAFPENEDQLMTQTTSLSPRSLALLAVLTIGLSAGCVPETPTNQPPGPDDPEAHYVLLDGVVGMRGTGFDFVLRSGSTGNTTKARAVIQSIVDELNGATGSTHRLLAGTISGAAGPNQVAILGVVDGGVACNYVDAIGCASPVIQGGYVSGGNMIYEGGLEDNRQLFAHEIGHALGLDHCTPDPAQIMCNDQDELTRYNTGDINGFRWLLSRQPPPAAILRPSEPAQLPRIP